MRTFLPLISILCVLCFGFGVVNVLSATTQPSKDVSAPKSEQPAPAITNAVPAGEAEDERAICPQFISSDGKSSLLLWSMSGYRDPRTRLNLAAPQAKVSWAPFKPMHNAPVMLEGARKDAPIRSVWWGDWAVCSGEVQPSFCAITTVEPGASSSFGFFTTNIYTIEKNNDEVAVTPVATSPPLRGLRDTALLMQENRLIIASESAMGSTIVTSVSHDRGKTFGSKCGIRVVGSYPQLVALDANTIMLLFTTHGGLERDFRESYLQYCLSEDGGKTWTKPSVVSNTHDVLQSAIVQDSSGRLHLLYSKREQMIDEANFTLKQYQTFAYNAFTTTSLWLATSDDKGKSWSTPRRITDGKFADHYPAITFTEDHIVLAWSRISLTKEEKATFEDVVGKIMTMSIRQ